MKIFLDTSSLIKLYHSEIGTQELDNVFEENKIDEIFLSEIAKVEFNSAIWKKVRKKELTEDEGKFLIDSFLSDYDNYTYIEISSEIVELSRDLVSKYGLKGLRTLDSFQLACIVKVKKKLGFAFTADELLKSLIISEGIKTK